MSPFAHMQFYPFTYFGMFYKLFGRVQRGLFFIAVVCCSFVVSSRSSVYAYDDGEGGDGGSTNGGSYGGGANICGDGIVRNGEQCDDANGINTDGCDTNCRLPKSNTGGNGTTSEGGTNGGTAPTTSTVPTQNNTPPTKETKLTRLEMAKLLVAFIQKQGTRAADTKKACVYDDVSKENTGDVTIMILACQFGIMGLQGDGITPLKSFRPHDEVPASELATAVSRLLRGNKYDGNPEQRYKLHIKALEQQHILNELSKPQQIQTIEKLLAALLLIEKQTKN